MESGDREQRLGTLLSQVRWSWLTASPRLPAVASVGSWSTRIEHGARNSYLPYLAVCVVSLLALGWAGLATWGKPDEGGFATTAGGRIREVVQGGEAWDAGIRVGDRLVAVDGVPLTKLDGLYRDKGPGDTVVYTLDRKGQRVQAPLVLGHLPLRQRLLSLEQLGVAFVFWLVSLVAWYIRPFDDITRRFYWGSQVAAIELALDLVARMRWIWPLFITDLLILLLAPLTVWFYSTFPQLPSPRSRHWLNWSVVGGACALACWTLIDAYTDGVVVMNPVLASARQAYVTLALLIAMGLLMRPARVSEHGRRRRRLLVVGMAMSLLPFVCLSFVPDVVMGSFLLDYRWTVPAFVGLPISFAYALVKGDLGPVDRLLNRSLVHLSTAALLLGSLLVGWAALDLFLIGSWNGLAKGGLAIGVGAIMYRPARDRMQQLVDRWFGYGEWPEYRRVVRRASDELIGVRDAEELMDRLFEIARTMRFRKSVLLWSKANELVLYAGPRPYTRELEVSSVPRDGALARWLTGQEGPVAHESLLIAHAPAHIEGDLTRTERALLAEDWIQVWLPLVSHGVLHGVLIAGQRQGERLLEAEDMDILHTVGKQAAIAAENIILVQELTDRLEQVEEVRDELAATQGQLEQTSQEERAALARDLHDGPLGRLIGMQYELFGMKQALGDKSQELGFGQVQEEINATILELRATCGKLRSPDPAAHGLAAAIRPHAHRVRERHPNLDIQLELMWDGRRLNEEQRRHLYHIYQEAMHNVTKHSGAKSVTVCLERRGSMAVLSVRDNGRGFPLPVCWADLARGEHFGLQGIAERAERMGGQLEVVSAPGEGTMLRATVPILPSSQQRQSEVDEGRIV